MSAVAIKSESATKTIYIDHAEKFYTKISNSTLRMTIPGEKVSAKDILLDALSCRSDWEMTTRMIAKRWGITIKYASKKLTTLVKAGHAMSRTITDKAGKILRRIWMFFETPQPQKQGYGENMKITTDNRPETPKNHNPKNGAMASIYKKEQKKEQKTTAPAPEPKPDPVQPVRAIEEPAAVFFQFTKDQKEKMGTHAGKIEWACKTIAKLPEKPGERFNPYHAAGKAIRHRMPASVIEETLCDMIKGWQTIKKPWAIFRIGTKIKIQNHNEQLTIQEHEDHKQERDNDFDMISKIDGIFTVIE